MLMRAWDRAVSRRARLNIFLEPEHAKALRDLSLLRGVSQSGVIAAALASFLSPDGADRREAAIAKRLDRLHHHCERIERDQTILVETLALFIRLHLSVTVPPAPEHADAARAQGRARFKDFIEQLGRHIQRGRSLVKDVHKEIYPDESRFFRLDDIMPIDGAANATDRGSS